jgi:multiple sugar transport system substrate-binding protein
MTRNRARHVHAFTATGAAGALPVGAALAAALACVALAGAPPAHASHDPKGRSGRAAEAGAGHAELELAVWKYGVPGEEELYRDIKADFERANPGVTVQLSMLTWDNALETARRSLELRGDAPDVILIRDDWLPVLASRLRPLTAEMEKRAGEEYYEGALDACRYGKNKLYGIPWMVRTQALFYRPDALRQAHVEVPGDWSQLVTAAVRVASPPDLFGFGIPGAASGDAVRLFLPMLWSTGAQLENERGELVFGVEALHVLSLLSELAVTQHGAEPETLSYSQPDLEALFVVGKLAMLVDGPWFAWYLDEKFPKLNYEVAPLPSGTRPASVVSVDFLAVPVNSNQPDLAARLINHLTQDRFLSTFAQLGGLPAKRSVVRSSEVAKDKRLKPFALEPAMTRTMFDVISGRKTPHEAWKEFHAPGLRLHTPEVEEEGTPPPSAPIPEAPAPAEGGG